MRLAMKSKVKVGDLLLVTEDWKYYANPGVVMEKGQVVIVSEIKSDNQYYFRVHGVDITSNRADWFTGDGDLFENITDLLTEE